MDLKGMVEGLFRGLAGNLGEASEPPDMIPAPDGLAELVLVRQGYELKRLEGPKQGQRRHTFTSVRDFGRWLRRHADPAAVDILATEREITAALAPQDPNGDLVSCKLEPHERAKPWLALFGKPLEQRDLFLFVRAHVADFADAHDAKGASLGSYGAFLAAELQKFSLVRGGKVEVRLDKLGGCEFIGQENTRQITGQLPPSFTLRLPLLQDVVLATWGDDGQVVREVTPTYDLEVFLEIEAEGLEFTLSCPGVAQAQLDARQDALRCLSLELAAPAPVGYLVGLGQVQLSAVPKPLV